VHEDDDAACADALWDATERLRAIEEAAPEGIVAVDRQGRVTIWNRAAEQLLGWRASDVIGRANPLIFGDEHGEDRVLAARLREGEALSQIETGLRRKDGSSIVVSVSSGPIRDAQGDIRGTIRILTDISEAKRVARQFLQAQKMAAFGQLAGGIAHDFNNLLTVIAGSSELVLEQVRDRPDITVDVEAIKDAAERAAQLTRQLLAFSRTPRWVLQVVDLNQILGAFQRVLHRIVRENIRLRIVAAPSLGYTKADPGQVEQVVMNLVVNACDAMPGGGALTITTANVVLDEAFVRQHVGAVAGRYVSLTVEDSGCGMMPDIVARVFEPFFTTKGPDKGTGLGLSTVFGLLEQSRGFITVASTVGVGTVVTTYWPTVDDAVERTVARSSERTRTGTETILLVEDEDGLRQLMGRVLERHGYQVLPARDAEAALAIEEGYADAIHLLVSDIIMPGLGGPDLAQHIVRHRPAIQVLLVSGYAPRTAHDLGQRLPHVSFLQKPFTPAILATQVRECLDRHLDPLTRP